MAAKQKPTVARQKSRPSRSAPTVSAAAEANHSNLTGVVDRLAARVGITSAALLSLALAVLTIAVYAQVWRFDFITIDDPQYVGTNAHVQYGLSLDGIKLAFSRSYLANWIPLTWISFMLDGSAYGAWPGGYHLTNLLLHTVNVLLLFHVLRKATGQEFSSAFAAALFAIHPIHAESVAWVTERKDVLSIFFGLLSLWAYVAYAQQKRWAAYGLSLALFVCSLMAKQTLVTLPGVLLLLDYWPLRRLSRRVLLEKIPYIAVSTLFCFVVIWAQAEGAAVRSLESAPLAVRFATAAIAYMTYLQKLILPWNLGVYYPYTTEISLVQLAAAITLLALATSAAVAWRQRYPFFTVGWFWYLGTLVPMIGLVQVGLQQMADRYAYFSFIGLYIAIAGFVTSRALAIAFVGVAAVLGFIQVGYWHDTLTLAVRTRQVTNDNAFVHYILADALTADDRASEALDQYRQAVRIEPANGGAHCKLAQALMGAGQADAARSQFEMALALDDKLATAHAGLGWFYAARRETAKAKKEFELAIKADPNDQTNYFNMAMYCRMNKDYEESIKYCEGALRINNNMIDAHHLLADNLRQLGRRDEADARLRYVLSIAPYDTQARELLGK
jgi:protein O-mannosyl-transferase